MKIVVIPIFYEAAYNSIPPSPRQSLMGETPIALGVSPWEKTALAPLNKGGTGKTSIKVPLKKGDLGGSRYVQLHIKFV
jgi:hypothetical protein